ncbi:hypothetical protein JJL45_03865 [Tamlana sp. s12]|uniref:hypothetical protein n=1 Tax=Tamlana sp. s12 TaxID=1630406 RepID=UPI000800D43D|nr:hypothetical protein [Tamlana sp. s12]OBQ55028.1 hypothetical protein VQ01_09830 [Tamlana sp. s12]QQY83140.1 hypothetical protein JJL45_03865 [Tamlana sp. s12]
MKNVLKHSKKGILMVIMCTAMLSFANEVSFFNIKNETSSTSLVLTRLKAGNLLSIKDSHGVIVHKEVIQATGNFSSKFDLTLLPNGAYKFEVDKGLVISSIPFTVKSGLVLFSKEEEQIIYKPHTRVEGNVVYISKLALNGEPLKIHIYAVATGYEGLLYSETIENTTNIERIYRLNGLEDGSHKIVFETEGREFIEHL